MEVFTEYRAEIFAAFWTTVQLTVLSAVGALVLGTGLAAMRLAPVPMLNWIGTTYVNVVRNTPLTLIILFCSFGLSQTLGLTMADRQSETFIADSGFRLAVLGFTVYTASFVCETVRSGVNTVPLGQAEAARSLGLTFGQNLRLILLPTPGMPSSDAVIVEDFLFERAPASTVVRLLSSGVPSAQRWVTYYLAKRRHWELALTRLKVFLEKGMDQEQPPPRY